VKHFCFPSNLWFFPIPSICSCFPVGRTDPSGLSPAFDPFRSGFPHAGHPSPVFFDCRRPISALFPLFLCPFFPLRSFFFPPFSFLSWNFFPVTAGTCRPNSPDLACLHRIFLLIFSLSFRVPRSIAVVVEYSLDAEFTASRHVTRCSQPVCLHLLCRRNADVPAPLTPMGFQCYFLSDCLYPFAPTLSIRFFFFNLSWVPGLVWTVLPPLVSLHTLLAPYFFFFFIGSVPFPGLIFLHRIESSPSAPWVHNGYYVL